MSRLGMRHHTCVPRSLRSRNETPWFKTHCVYRLVWIGLNEPSICIEKARPEDSQEILRVINETNREAFGRIIPKEHFKEPILTREELCECLEKMTFYLLRHEEQTVAVAALSVEDEDSGRIRWVYVLPAYQNRGFGTALVRHLEKVGEELGLKKMKLVTDDGAKWAIRFYHRLGYTLAHSVPNPWGFDVWMEKQLPLQPDTK